MPSGTRGGIDVHVNSSRHGSVALGLGLFALGLAGVAFVVRDEEGATILGFAALLGLVGLGRACYELAKPEDYRGGPAAVGLVLSMLTGIGGAVVVIWVLAVVGGLGNSP